MIANITPDKKERIEQKSKEFTTNTSYTENQIKRMAQVEIDKNAHSLRFLKKMIKFHEENFKGSKLKYEFKEDLDKTLELFTEQQLVTLFDIKQFYSDNKQLGIPNEEEKEIQKKTDVVICTPAMEDGYRGWLFNQIKKRIPGGKYVEKLKKKLEEKGALDKEIQELQAKIQAERAKFEEALKNRKEALKLEKIEKSESLQDDENAETLYTCDVCGEFTTHSKRGLTLHKKKHKEE